MLGKEDSRPLIALSYAAPDSAHAEALKALLVEQSGAEVLVFEYQETPLRDKNLLKQLRSVFQGSKLIVPLVGATYQHHSAACGLEESIVADRVRKNPNGVEVLFIGDVKPEGVLQAALHEVQSLGTRVPAIAWTLEAFRELAAATCRILDKLQRKTGQVPSCPRYYDDGPDAPVHRHLHGFKPALASKNGKHPGWVRVAQEGLRSSAVLLSHLQQQERAVRVRDGLLQVVAASADEHGRARSSGTSNQWYQRELFTHVRSAVREVLLQLDTPGRTNDRTRVELGNLYVLLRRFECYLARHLAHTTKFPDLAARADALIRIALYEGPAPPDDLLSAVVDLSIFARDAADRLAAHFWADGQARWEVAKPARYRELRAFREQRQLGVKRRALEGSAR